MTNLLQWVHRITTSTVIILFVQPKSISQFNHDWTVFNFFPISATQYSQVFEIRLQHFCYTNTPFLGKRNKSVTRFTIHTNKSSTLFNSQKDISAAPYSHEPPVKIHQGRCTHTCCNTEKWCNLISNTWKMLHSYKGHHSISILAFFGIFMLCFLFKNLNLENFWTGKIFGLKSWMTLILYNYKFVYILV